LVITQQRSDGSWGRQPSEDVSLASQLVFLLAFLERDDSELAYECAATILRKQRGDGAWSIEPEGAADVSASVQAYFALKLTGHDPTDEPMVRARERIRTLGGADASDSYTRFFLALLGQLNYDFCGPMPGKGVSSGTQQLHLRTPLSLIRTHRPVRAVPMERGVRELFVNRPSDWPLLCVAGEEVSHEESQELDNLEPNEISELSVHDLLWRIIALRTIEGRDSPELSICEVALDQLTDIDEATEFPRSRFRDSSLADSAIALRALLESGMTPKHPAIEEGADLLCQSPAATSAMSIADAHNLVEGLHRYAVTESEISSALPPDIDVRWDWQYSELPVEQLPEWRREAIDSTIASHVERCSGDQKLDGGWSAATGLCERIQSSQPDETGAALELLAGRPEERTQVAINGGVTFLQSRQLGDGSWTRTDGTQQVSCTSAAIRGLIAAATSADEDCVAAAVNWLVVQQQASGDWNGSAAQTASAILGLVVAGRADHSAVRRGIQFLLDAQDDDGGWMDQHALRDGDSNLHFRADLHSVCWPLLALSRFAVAASSAQPAATREMSLRLVATTAGK
jgi:squalene-hopene/tetraprenyl-beta-curcumene cyclase